MNEIILMADPRVTDIPVNDCGGPLVDVSTCGFMKIDWRRADASGYWLLVRSGLDAHTLRQLASRYVSPPEIAPHSAGAAIDLSLCTNEGEELDMGTPVNASPEASDFGCNTAALNISSTARANRDTLAGVLTEAGLVNYPTEWWHWSYGDRYWALRTAHPTAIYGTHVGRDPER